MHPGADETCNFLDDDCNGLTDDGEGAPTYQFLDFDGDEYGDPKQYIGPLCPIDGYVLDDTDCNDQNDEIHPGATEVCSDGVDNNCDGVVDSCRTSSYIDFSPP
jgi:hypothetical protein